jgi:CBS domain-containing protein
MTLETIAREEVVSVAPTTDVVSLAERLRDDSIGCVVVTDDEKPVGIVTDRDIAIKVVGEGTDPTGVTANDVMTREPATAHEDEGVFDLVRTMNEHGVRRMPIVDDDGTLTGIVTFDDLFVMFRDEFEELGDVLEAGMPPY